MKRLSDNAIELINRLNIERLDYSSEYVPLIEAAFKLQEYEDMESTMSELKPCPFCGGQADISIDPEAVVDTEGRRWVYTVVCNRCCATSGLTYLPEKAREAWNRRGSNA